MVYAKDLNLYRMSREDYEKLKKNEKDSTITEIQITTDGVKDFGYGQPYSLLNTDTLCNGKRKAVWGLRSPDSRHFATLLSDDRKVKELWVINSVAEPRPTLETYKYQMPGEMEAPEEHLYLFDMADNSRKEIKTDRFKNQSLSLAYRPRQHRQRHMYDVLSRMARRRFPFLRDPLKPRPTSNRHLLLHRRAGFHRPHHRGEDEHVSGGASAFGHRQRQGTRAMERARRLVSSLSLRRQRQPQTQADRRPWHVHHILKVDEPRRMVYFTAMGREKDENPYYQHLYGVSLDGAPVKRLDKGIIISTCRS